MRSSSLRFAAVMVALFLVRLPAVAADKPIPGGIHITHVGPQSSIVGLKQPAFWNLTATTIDQLFVNDETLQGGLLWLWTVDRVQTKEDKNWIDDPNWNKNPTLSKDVITLAKTSQTATSSTAKLSASFVTPGFKRIRVKVRHQFRGKDGTVYGADRRTYLVVAVMAVKSVELKIDPTGRGLPGGIVLVNHGDVNFNQTPDYSDLAFPVDQHPDMVPMSLTIMPANPAANLDWDKVAIVFDYPGAKGDQVTVQKFEGTKLDSVNRVVDRVVDRQVVPTVEKMRDYSGAKQGVLRIWRLPPATRPNKYRQIDDYLAPGEVYKATDLGFAGRNNRVFLFLEGINAQGNVAIKVNAAGMAHSQMVQVVEPNIGVNNSNFFAGAGRRPLRAGVPDVPFFIDEHVADGRLVIETRTPGPDFANDEMVEDQGEGFCFWWAHDTDEMMNALNVTDWVPMVIDIPKELLGKGFRFVLQMTIVTQPVKDVHLVFGRAIPTTPLNRRKFLQDEATFKQQGGQINARNGVFVLSSEKPSWEITDFIGNNAGRHELLFRANFKKAGVIPTVKAILRLGVSDPQGKVTIPADQFVVTLRPVHEFYSLYSVRADAVKTGKGAANPRLKFPVEGEFYPIDDKFIAIPAKLQYPDAQILADNRISGRKNYFITIHGFNVSLDDAIDQFNEEYRRVFWLGFRGNYVGLTWDGDAQP